MHRVDLGLLSFYSPKDLKLSRSKYGCTHFLHWSTVGTRAGTALKTFTTRTSGLSEVSAVRTAVWPALLLWVISLDGPDLEPGC